jgi:hypothetical protein
MGLAVALPDGWVLRGVHRHYDLTKIETYNGSFSDPERADACETPVAYFFKEKLPHRLFIHGISIHWRIYDDAFRHSIRDQ